MNAIESKVLPTRRKQIALFSADRAVPARDRHAARGAGHLRCPDRRTGRLSQGCRRRPPRHRHPRPRPGRTARQPRPARGAGRLAVGAADRHFRRTAARADAQARAAQRLRLAAQAARRQGPDQCRHLPRQRQPGQPQPHRHLHRRQRRCRCDHAGARRRRAACRPVARTRRRHLPGRPRFPERQLRRLSQPVQPVRPRRHRRPAGAAGRRTARCHQAVAAQRPDHLFLRAARPALRCPRRRVSS